MILELGLLAHISADTRVAALIATATRVRFFPLFIPQKDKAIDQVPCAVYQITQEERQKTFCGTQKLLSATVQIDSYAVNLIEARELSNALRAALVDFRGFMGDVQVRDVTLVGGLALHDFDPGLMRVMDTYTIWYEEE